VALRKGCRQGVTIHGLINKSLVIEFIPIGQSFYEDTQMEFLAEWIFDQSLALITFHGGNMKKTQFRFCAIG